MSHLMEAGALKRPAAGDGGSNPHSPLVRSRTAIDIQRREIDWLWSPLVPFGGITVLAGQPGLGKSLLTVRLAAEFSAGRLERSGDVLMLTAEDPIPEVVVPRLEAARAKLSVVHFGDMQADGLSLPLRFPQDVDKLGELISAREAKLVVIDPLSAHLEARVDSWKDQSIRSALAPLAALAAERKVAVVVVAHLNKGQSTDPLQRLGGSVGLPAAARSVLLLGRDPDDPEGKHGSRRVLAQVKSNFGRLAGSLRYEIKDAVVRDPLVATRAAAIFEAGSSPYSGSDLLAPSPVGGELPAMTAEAVAFLREALAEGPRRAKELEEEAQAAAISWDTVKRSKSAAGVRTRKERGTQNGSWIWELAGAEARTEQQAA